MKIEVRVDSFGPNQHEPAETIVTLRFIPSGKYGITQNVRVAVVQLDKDVDETKRLALIEAQKALGNALDDVTDMLRNHYARERAREMRFYEPYGLDDETGCWE